MYAAINLENMQGCVALRLISSFWPEWGPHRDAFTRTRWYKEV